MVVELKRAGFSLDELGELPPSSWRDLYVACRSRYYAGLSELVAVAHPDKPQDVQGSFKRASESVWGPPEVPVWADPERFKAALGMSKVVVKPEEKA